MKIEERDFYNGLPIIDDFLIHERPGAEDMLMYKRRGNDGIWQNILKQFGLVYYDTYPSP